MLRPLRTSLVRRAAVAALLLGALAGGCGESSPGGASTRDATTTAAVATARVAARPGRLAAGAPAAKARAGAAATARPASAARVVAPAHPIPAAFRPAPGASSDAEVRSELAQMEALQRRAHRAALSAAAASLAGLLPWVQEPRTGVQTSVASVFTDYGLGLACGGVLGRSELGVAHKTAPCGTLVTFTYAGRSLTVPVIDRGPYIAGREWDLTGATAAALGFPGLGPIEWSLAH